jgi:diguanylate cyclase (GGDEF)-like protein
MIRSPAFGFVEAQLLTQSVTVFWRPAASRRGAEAPPVRAVRLADNPRVESGTGPALPRILLIDDSPSSLRLLVEALRGSYRVHVATSGAEALGIVARERPDLVLLDIVMPEMDGYEVCRRLKRSVRTRDVPVIFVTAQADESDEAEGFELGGVDYIRKPFRLPLVLARIRTHLELASLRQRLEDQSRLDPLTGISNRATFDTMLADAWAASRESGLPMALVLADVDHFKAYNDHYGHQAGDEALRRVATAIAEGVRREAGEVAARFGGEEFAVLLPEADQGAARRVAERVRSAVEALAIPHAYSSAADRVTLSVGLATAIGDLVAAPRNLVEAADAALYRSKGAGRNRVSS